MQTKFEEGPLKKPGVWLACVKILVEWMPWQFPFFLQYIFCFFWSNKILIEVSYQSVSSVTQMFLFSNLFVKDAVMSIFWPWNAKWCNSTNMLEQRTRLTLFLEALFFISCIVNHPDNLVCGICQLSWWIWKGERNLWVTACQPHILGSQMSTILMKLVVFQWSSTRIKPL